MSSKEQQIPAIRFNGFTDTWEQRKLGEHCEMFNGDRSSKYPNAQDMVSDGIPFINAGDLENGHVNLKTAKKISREKYDELGGAKLQLGDIVYCLRGTLGKNAYIDNFDKGTVASSLVAIRPKNIDGRYLYYILNSEIEYKQRIVRDEGAAQPNLSAKSVSEFVMPVPDIAEQKKISAYFSNLDHLIALHQRQMDNYKELKKTSMQKIFNQELRFKDKNGNDYPVWQKKKLKDLGKFYSGTGFNDKYQGYLDLSIPFFKVSDMNIASNSKYMVESNNTVDDDICREMKINKITGPAILFAKVGAAIYMERKRIVHNDFLMDNNMMALRINDSVDIEFTYYLCQSLSFSKYAQVGALPSYNASDIGRLHCKLPVISEQKKIAIFLSILDQKVNEAAQKVELFKELKKGLMQQMFF